MKEHIRNLLDIYMEKNPTGHSEVTTIFVDTLCTLKKYSPERFQEVVSTLEDLAYNITMKEADDIVRHMEPKGIHWSYKQVEDFINTKKEYGSPINWYLVMNMVYNDYYNTAKVFGHQDDVNFYYHLAKDFIQDPDAKPYKVEKYFS